MSNRILSILILSAILFSGCTTSKPISSETSSTKKSAVSVPKTITDTQNPSSTINNAEVKETPKKVIAPPLTSTENARINDKVTSVVTSVDEVLNSLDDANELNLN